MWINLQNPQPVGLVTDSTESTESREISEYLQAEVDEYTKHIVDLILDNPYISARFRVHWNTLQELIPVYEKAGCAEYTEMRRLAKGRQGGSELETEVCAPRSSWT